MDSVLFVLYKAAFAVLRPDTALILLVAAAFWAVLRGHLRPARWLAGSALAAMLVIALLPVGQFVLLPLETRYPPDPPVPDDIGGIIVLGGGEDGAASHYWQKPMVNGAGERFTEALALAQRFPEAPVIWTGGIVALTPAAKDATSMGAWVLQDLGLRPPRLLIEPSSRNTAENARLSLDLAPDRGDRPWLLVTSAFHMRRSVETFCAAGWQNLVPWPTDFRTAPQTWGPKWNFALHLETLVMSTKEWMGLVGYRATGRGGRPDASCLARPPV
ncbi:YdcF family protein [Chachezhania antarctica]|uniref:YdcF family protein n=1 Tax=Chachezhania antarctica TaxID=2340860 RepID=UPI0013CE8CA7|nr:YdcF family protein [Chachezhania antarctica]